MCCLVKPSNIYSKTFLLSSFLKHFNRGFVKPRLYICPSMSECEQPFIRIFDVSFLSFDNSHIVVNSTMAVIQQCDTSYSDSSLMSLTELYSGGLTVLRGLLFYCSPPPWSWLIWIRRPSLNFVLSVYEELLPCTILLWLTSPSSNFVA